MKTTNAIDALNHKTMRLAVDEYSAMVDEALCEAERQALDGIRERVKDKRILDLGIGAGRTVGPLRAISKNYIGVDYVQEMVDHCRSRFPEANLQIGDARSLPQFADASFDLVVFACNGICMVDHEGRLAILREVHRQLAPGGIFVFSTRNRNSRAYRAWFLFPEFQFSRNPLKLAVRSVRFLTQTIRRAGNRLKYRGHEVKNAGYAIINDVYHHYRVMLYFITLSEQRRQLAQAGFKPDARAYRLSGELVTDDCTDETLTLVAEKI